MWFVCINDIAFRYTFFNSETGGNGAVDLEAQAQMMPVLQGSSYSKSFYRKCKAVGLFVNHTDSTGNPSTGFINSKKFI